MLGRIEDRDVCGKEEQVLCVKKFIMDKFLWNDITNV